MPTFDRPRGETPDAEQKMVSEEVSEGEERIVFEEDPVEQMAREVLNAEKHLADARRKADGGRDSERRLLVAEFLLTKTRVDQAKHSAGLGKAKPGELGRLEAQLQAAHKKLDAFNGQGINATRKAAFARFGNDESRVGPDTEELLERLAS